MFQFCDEVLEAFDYLLQLGGFRLKSNVRLPRLCRLAQQLGRTSTGATKINLGGGRQASKILRNRLSKAATPIEQKLLAQPVCALAASGSLRQANSGKCPVQRHYIVPDCGTCKGRVVEALVGAGPVPKQNPGAQAYLPPEDRFDQKFSLDQWALYVEDEWRIRDDVALTLGLRYNDHDMYGGHVTPCLYAVWDATPRLTVKGGISAGFRAPDIRTATPGYAYTTGGSGCASNTPPSCGVILGNEDLEPEETTNIEIGTVHETGAFTFSATAFHTRFKNKLQQVTLQNPDGSPVLWTDGPQYSGADGSLNSYRIDQNFNVDKAKITGLELAGDWDVTPTLSARATYTYTRSRQKSGDFEGFPLARTPEHMASLRLDWVTPVSGLDTWLAATYHGSEIASGLRIGEEGREITINGVTGRKYSPYTTVDLGLSYRVTDTATVNAVVYNALNKEIREDEFKAVVEGRRLWLGFTADF